MKTTIASLLSDVQKYAAQVFENMQLKNLMQPPASVTRAYVCCVVRNSSPMANKIPGQSE